MVELLIAVAAAAFGAATAIIVFVAWAVRREDAYLSLAEEAPGPVASAVRRLLGLHVIGMSGPGRPRGTGLSTGPGHEDPGTHRTPAGHR